MIGNYGRRGARCVARSVVDAEAIVVRQLDEDVDRVLAFSPQRVHALAPNRVCPREKRAVCDSALRGARRAATEVDGDTGVVIALLTSHPVYSWTRKAAVFVSTTVERHQIFLAVMEWTSAGHDA